MLKDIGIALLIALFFAVIFEYVKFSGVDVSHIGEIVTCATFWLLGYFIGKSG